MMPLMALYDRPKCRTGCARDREAKKRITRTRWPSGLIYANRASRQTRAALTPCSLRMRLNSARSGPPLSSM
jgi:hypothetical protein